MISIDTTLLQRMKIAITDNKLYKSDKHHNIDPYFPIDVECYGDKCIVKATSASDSTIWLHTYEKGDLNGDPKAFLNAVDAAGAYTKTGWQMLQRLPDATVDQMMERFNIRSSIRPINRTPLLERGEAYEIAEMLREWSRVRALISNEDCYAEDKLTFMRDTKRKKAGEIERTNCMDGLCIERALVERLPNVRDSAW